MKLGEYELLDELGRGGMGAVYRARHAVQGHVVAVKVMTGTYDDVDVKRFVREAQAGVSVEHENVIRVLGAGSDKGRPFIVLELAPGGSIASRLQAEQRLPWPETVRIAAAVARGLAAVHAAGFVHRDLKPGNVLLAKDGTPKLADFGLVKPQDRSSTLTGTSFLVGTPAFMAPEQADGKPVSAASDLYSLGALLFTMLTGEPPFSGTGYGLLKKVLSERPRSVRAVVPDVPAELDALVAKLLAKSPEARGSTEETLAALEALVDGEALRGEEKAEEATGRSRAPLAVLAVAVVAVAGGGALLARRPAAAPPSVPPGSPPAPRPPAARAFAMPSLPLTNGLEALTPELVAGFRLTWAWGDAAFAETFGTTDLCWSPDGTRLVSCGGAEGASLWDARTGALLEVTPSADPTAATAVAFVGERVLVGSLMGRVSSFVPGKSSTVVWTCDRGIVGLGSSADGRSVVAVSGRGETIAVPLDGRRASPLAGARAANVLGASVAPDGRRALSWTVEGGAIVTGARSASTVLPDHGVTSGAFLPGRDEVLLAVDGELRRYELGGKTGGHAVATLEEPHVTRLAVSPDGRTVAAAGEALALIDVATGSRRVLEERSSSWPVRAVAFSPDGARLASGGDRRTIRVWDVASGQPVSPLAARTAGPLNAVAATRDGRFVALGAEDGAVRVLDTSDGSLVSRWQAPATISGVAASDDGSVALACTSSEKVHVFALDPRAAGGRDLRPFGAVANRETVTVALGVDGRGATGLLAGTGEKCGVLVLDVARGTTATLSPADGNVTSSQPLSRDGTRAVSFDGKLRLWDTKARTAVGSLDIGSAPVRLALAPGGDRVAFEGFGEGRVLEVRRFADGASLYRDSRPRDGLPGPISFIDDDTLAATRGSDIVLVRLDAPQPAAARVSVRAMGDLVAGYAPLEKGALLVATRRGRLLRFERVGGR